MKKIPIRFDCVPFKYKGHTFTVTEYRDDDKTCFTIRCEDVWIDSESRRVKETHKNGVRKAIEDYIASHP